MVEEIVKIYTHSSAEEFIDECSQFLYQDEVFHNRIISTAEMISSGTAVYGNHQWFAAAHNQRHVMGCALYAEPDGLMLARMPIEIADALLSEFGKSEIQPSRLICDSGLASNILDGIGLSKSLSLRVDGVWNIFSAESVRSPGALADGVLRPAEASDLPEVRAWGRQYDVEVPAIVSIEEFFGRKLEENGLFVWDHNGPAAVLSISAITTNGICVSAIFTPKRFRKRGYATAILFKSTELLLSEGFKFVTLSVLEGSSAIRIYKSLGFKKVAQRTCFVRDSN